MADDGAGRVSGDGGTNGQLKEILDQFARKMNELTKTKNEGTLKSEAARLGRGSS